MQFIALPHKRCAAIFCARNQTLAVVYSPRACGGGQLCAAARKLSSERRRSLLGLPPSSKGGTAVELTLKWDVLAVGAVFLFVGAILLGAF
jgi:hypothetical protein